MLAALDANTSYRHHRVLGLPGSVLDRQVFPEAPFLKDAPYLTCMLENPNHIGCHTLGNSEGAFAGTQALEREVLQICAEELLGAAPGGTDGYVASGGTEANIQAMWIARNHYRRVHGAGHGEVAVLHSQDAHYSVVKGADLLDLTRVEVPVDPSTRRMQPRDLRRAVLAARRAGVRYCLVFLTMGTTMFGSVDELDPVAAVLDDLDVEYLVHVDAAFGGFVYPLTNPDNLLDFRDPRITSFTLDAHKMLQAPYGTGLFLCRKGWMDEVRTPAASYVPGADSTVCGSRSGANAVAVWMILQTYGSEGGEAFLGELMLRTERLCAELRRRRVAHFREPHMNVVTLRDQVDLRPVFERFQLVPDAHDGAPGWWKIVVMDHVEDRLLDEFLQALPAPPRYPRPTDPD